MGVNMTARLDEGLPPVNPLPHPTPLHIRECIDMRLRSDPSLPFYTIMRIVQESIRDACREHDTEQWSE
jgi:hypothetical protein